MPLGRKDKEILKNFEKYAPSAAEGKRIYYATLNKRINQRRPIRTTESRRLIKKRKHYRNSRRKV